MRVVCRAAKEVVEEEESKNTTGERRKDPFTNTRHKRAEGGQNESQKQRRTKANGQEQAN